MRIEICPVCQNNNIEFLEKFSKWDLYWCRGCDAQFWWPLKHPGQKFYEEEYDPTGVHGKAALSWGNRQFLRDSILEKGKILDIGCSFGDFLNELQKRDFEAWGIDISERSIAVAKALNLRNVYGGTIEAFSARQNVPDFDVVTFFEVIEHLDDPRSFIKHSKKVLKNGGYLVLSTPDRECWGGWHDTPPQHLFKWNEKVLQYLLRSQGFEIVKVVREPISYKYFFYRFFKSASPLSFGFVAKIKEKLRKKLVSNKSSNDIDILKNKPNTLRLVEQAAKFKIGILKILFVPAVLAGRLLGLKWQSIYIVARLEE